MHIDYEKFISLVAENSGLTHEKVEKQLGELLAEMAKAFDEGEAYEIEGFGIFSKLGNAVHFMSSDELDTEINYKYAGMEPLEITEGEQENTDFTVSAEEEHDEEFDDPFEIDGDRINDEAETDEEMDDVLSEFIESQRDTIADEDDDETVSDSDSGEKSDVAEDPFAEILDSLVETDFEESSHRDTENEAAAQGGAAAGDNEETSDNEDAGPGPDDWGIEAHKQEGQESAFSGLFSDDEEETEKEEESAAELDMSAELEEVIAEERKETQKEDEFIPVVTDISSKKATTGNKTAKRTGKKSAEIELNLTEKKQDGLTIVALAVYLILILGSTVAMGFVLNYYGIINLSNINLGKKTPATTQIMLPPIPPIENEDIAAALLELANGGVAENLTQQTVVEAPAASSAGADESATGNNAAGNQAVYGLTGTINEAANNGYTIVLYHLSLKAGADRELTELNEKGLRTLVKEVPSAKYGVLYRISVGQFKTMVDAVHAVEENNDLFRSDYSITKIN